MGKVLHLSTTDRRSFPGVPELDKWQAQVLGEAGGESCITTRTRAMLSMLGLGIEQTMTWLAQTRPSPDEFRRWIVQMAGVPSPDALARYIALVRGEPIPKAAKDRIDTINLMPPVLDERELTRWEHDGYAILQNAIAPGEVRALICLVWELAEARQDVPATWYGARPQGIMLQHFQSPQQDVARYSARIHKAFAQLWGTADLWPSIDRLGFSPPVTDAAPFRASPLHWDCSLHRPVPYGMFGVLYLTDTAAEQGAFRLVPGFHRRLDAWLDDLGEQDPRLVDLEDEAVPIPGRAGDLIICRHDLPHGASPNRAGSPRLVQYLSMFPPWFEEQSVWR